MTPSGTEALRFPTTSTDWVQPDCTRYASMYFGETGCHANAAATKSSSYDWPVGGRIYVRSASDRGLLRHKGSWFSRLPRQLSTATFLEPPARCGPSTGAPVMLWVVAVALSALLIAHVVAAAILSSAFTKAR